MPTSRRRAGAGNAAAARTGALPAHAQPPAGRPVAGLGGAHTADAARTAAPDGLRQDRVELERGDLREVVGEPADTQKQVLERGGVRGRRATMTEQQRGGLGSVDEGRGVVPGQRRDPVRAVADELGDHATDAERDDRPEQKVLHRLTTQGTPVPAIRCTNRVEATCAPKSSAMAAKARRTAPSSDRSRRTAPRSPRCSSDGVSRLDHNREPEPSGRLDRLVGRRRP